MDHPDELTLISSFRDGDEQAFNQLVIRYREKIYWIVRRMVSSHEEANDIVQDVFIKVYTSLHSFKGESSFYTWIYRIAVNITLNELRKKKIRRAFSLDDESIQPADLSAHPGELMEKKEISALLVNAIASLPEKQKKVFMLRYYEELPYDEIAKILKTSVGGLKANYFHAIRKIGKYIRHEI